MLRDEIISNAEQVMEFHTMGYRDSWEVDGASVGSDHPAVYRLEFGFVGIDSMGRHVSQAPREHIRTAIITVSERHFRGAGMVFEEGLRSVRT